MRYKKVQRVAFLGNSNRSLFLRKKCAQKMLSILNEGKTVVNIDESWLSESDFKTFVSHLIQKLHAFEVNTQNVIFLVFSVISKKPCGFDVYK